MIEALRLNLHAHAPTLSAPPSPENLGLSRLAISEVANVLSASQYAWFFFHKYGVRAPPLNGLIRILVAVED